MSRHVGDIGSLTITEVDSSVSSFFSLTRDLLTLGGDGSASLSPIALASIIGRSIVMHADVDHCESAQPSGASGTPIVQGVIGIIDPARYGYAGFSNLADQQLATAPVSALAVVRSVSSVSSSFSPINGSVQFGLSVLDASKVRVIVSLDGLPPNATLGFHVHTYGDDAGTDGLAAGGHWSALHSTHEVTQ